MLLAPNAVVTPQPASLLSATQCSVTRAAAGSLELDRVLIALSQHARTRPGQQRCLSQELAPTVSEARARYAVVSEALACDNARRPPLCHTLDLDESISIARGGMSLPVPALVEVAEALESLSSLAGWGQGAASAQPPSPLMAELATASSPPERLVAVLVGAFEEDTDGAVRLSSAAWPQLKRRREAAASADGRLRSQIGELTRRSDVSPVMRDGRLVIATSPAEMRSVGSEVARSRSGSTVFVEPYELVELSAATRAAHAAVATAETRIISALSALVAAHSDAVADAIAMAAELDAAVARALLGEAWGGLVPEVGSQGVVRLCRARHPVLLLEAKEPSAVVANDVRLAATQTLLDGEGGVDGGGGSQGLLITGANGGGKSAIIKNVGLAALLSRLAVPLPCERAVDGEPPRFDFFSAVIADVSDTQAKATPIPPPPTHLQTHPPPHPPTSTHLHPNPHPCHPPCQSLHEGASSFAAHMRTCTRALAVADAARADGTHALFLLDEPGASTDPVQGGAIARAVVEAALDAGALLMVSTHSNA